MPRTKKINVKEAKVDSVKVEHIKLEDKNEIKEIKSKSKGKSLIFILIILIVIGGIVYLIKNNKETEPVTGNFYELTDVSVLDSKIPANLVSVKGVKLMDTTETVIEKINKPDFERSYPPNIVNFEYASTIDTLGTGIVMHFEDNILKKITIAEPFNKFLKDNLKPGSSTDDLYNALGKPTTIRFIQESQNSGKALKQIVFGDLGYEFVMDKDKIKFYSLVLPDKIKNKGVVKIV